MRKITKVEPAAPALPQRKRVAAYARVSMESERLLHSLSAQVSYYNELIQKNPAWEFAGVYADSGVSGTGTARRAEFLRLLSDCENGLIDIVLVKSISRFARNTVDLLETVRHLKSIGVEVRFEKENISALSGDRELMLSILASFAQEESRSLSENIKWAIRKGYENGAVRNCMCYGYRVKDGELVIEPTEAAVVRNIFAWYLAGDSCYQICKKLNAAGAVSYYGKKFSGGVVNGIIRQEKYTGNMLAQKYYVENHITHRERKNAGELPMYYAEDTHPAIVSQEVFDAVQVEIASRYGVKIINGIAESDSYMHHPKDVQLARSEFKRRKAVWSDAARAEHAEVYKSRDTFAYLHYDLSLFLKCETCGQNLTVKIRRYADGTAELWWECFKHNKFAPGAERPKPMQDARLKQQIAAVLEIPEFNAEKMCQQLTHISVRSDMLVFHFSDGRSVTRQYLPGKRQYRRKVEAR